MMPKVKTRTVKDELGRNMVQHQTRCTHRGCSVLVWCTVGMPGHPCCNDCYKKVHEPVFARIGAEIEAGKL